MAIQRALERLLRNRTAVVIAHRLSTIAQSSQIVVMHEGEVVERGTHDELLKRQGAYHQLYTMQWASGEDAISDEGP